MSFDVKIKGSFSVHPPADLQPPQLGDWQISLNGQILYLPEDSEMSANVFATLEEVCQRLKDSGHRVNGEARWIGEDESAGTIRIRDNEVAILDDPAEPLAESEISRLLDQIRLGDEAAQIEAIEVLDHFSISPDPVVDLIARNLTNSSLQVRMKAAAYLGNLEEKAVPKIDDLIKALKDKEPWMRAAAAEALGNLGKFAEPAIPHLEILSKDSNYGPGGRAKEALEKIRSNNSMSD